MSNTPQYPAAQPHAPIDTIFPDLFLARGQVRMGPGMTIGRNMTIVRKDGVLTLINPIRLSSSGEQELEALGEVQHVMRLGMFHGMDDPYYVDRYSANFWCQANSKRYPEPKVTHLLEEGGELPFSDATLFLFQLTRKPEAALLDHANGGTLISCDSVQHWDDLRQCSFFAKIMTRAMGFRGTTIGGPWKKYMTPHGSSLEPDFRRLEKLQFLHAISAHGGFIKDQAHERLKAAVNKAY